MSGATKSARIAMQAISEARSLLQDLQGQDGEFAS